MVVHEMSSRERMLAALSCRPPDHTPCSFMLWGGLRAECGDDSEFLRRQVALGLDACVELPPRPQAVVNDHYNLHGLPVSYDPRVTIDEWIEHLPDEDLPVMIKEYHTPAGTLRAEVRQTADWRWGNHVPFLDDYLVPRSRKFLVAQPEDLAALRYLLVPPTQTEVDSFKATSAPSLQMAREDDMLVTGGWGVGADLLAWICGLENVMFAAHDRPGFVHELLETIADWNRARMRAVLEMGVDLYIKRAWYENCDFWSPRAWREFICPVVRQDAALCHDSGARFGYIVTSNCMPLLEMFADAGIDALIGVDPLRWDLQATKQRIGGKVCLWGGVNGYLTVETGAAAEVRAEVRRAMAALAPGGGFILSPVDNVRENTPLARANAAAVIDEWQRLANSGNGTSRPPMR